MKPIKFFNKKIRRDQWRVRFKINNKVFRPVADTRSELLALVDEIRLRERRLRYELPVTSYAPALSALFSRHAPAITKPAQRTLFNRVSQLFLELLPQGLVVSELKQAHFQLYIDARRLQPSKHTGKTVLNETIDKELFALSSALKAAPRYFSGLDNYAAPKIPRASAGEKPRKRTRLIDTTNELPQILAALREPRQGKQTLVHQTARERLADDLEFRFETGLRRKESARLKTAQYKREEGALRDVNRWKTGTVTPFLPLSKRAIEIIEQRIETNPGAKYLFTADGEPVPSDYRTLKTLCEELEIPYGRYTEGGFIPHDFRHSFATEIARVTDIETARSLTGHTGNAILTYLHTDENRQRQAIAAREQVDITAELRQLWAGARAGEIEFPEFAQQVKALMR